MQNRDASSVADTKYLVKQHNTWLVSIRVPKALQEAAGCSRFKKSLQTDSLTQANRIKYQYVAEFKARIEALRRGESNADFKRLALASEYREALKNSPNVWQEDPDGREFNEYSEEMSRLKDEAKDILLLEGPEAARRFFADATGNATRLKDQYPAWLAEVEVAGQTKAQHKATIGQFLAWAGETITIEEINRKKSGAYASHLLQTGKARRTRKRHASSLSMLWRWLIARGFAEENVWRGLELGKKQAPAPRRQLNDSDILSLLRGTYSTPRYAQILKDLLRLALLTGARLEELCALRAVDVTKKDDGYWLEIVAGKTDAAQRLIPLHEIGAPIVQRRLEDKDEYLFKGLEPGGPDEKRSWYVSKAYARFRKQEDVGVSGKGQDFHALRNTFIAMMEGAGVAESTVKLLVGHARSSITFGLYSKGERVDLRGAINKIEYGPEVTKELETTTPRPGEDQ